MKGSNVLHSIYIISKYTTRPLLLGRGLFFEFELSVFGRGLDEKLVGGGL